MVTGTSTSPKRCWLARARTAASSGDSASRGSAPFASALIGWSAGRWAGGRFRARGRRACGSASEAVSVCGKRFSNGSNDATSRNAVGGRALALRAVARGSRSGGGAAARMLPRAFG